MLKTLFVIGMGSFAGGALRYLASRVIQNTFTCSIPLGTLFVNIMGCFIIGLLYGLFEKGQIMNTSLRLFLTVGFCGGFTTFSTFMNESFLSCFLSVFESDRRFCDALSRTSDCKITNILHTEYGNRHTCKNLKDLRQ